jgi:hypothetical protein
LKPRPDKGFALGDYRSTFLHTAFKENPKIYSMEQMHDNMSVRVVVHDIEEEEEIEEESRSKMIQKPFCKPYDYSATPHISKSFVPQKEIPEQSWYVTESYVSSSNAAPVQTVAQTNGPLPSSGEITPLPKRCRVLEYFKTFMEDIENLEDAIERNSEIKLLLFNLLTSKKREKFFKNNFCH